MSDYPKCPDCGGAITYGLGSCPHSCGASGDRYREMLSADINNSKKELLVIIQKMREELIKLREEKLSFTTSATNEESNGCVFVCGDDDND